MHTFKVLSITLPGSSFPVHRIMWIRDKRSFIHSNIVRLVVLSIHAVVLLGLNSRSRQNYECTSLLPWSKYGTRDIIYYCLEDNNNAWTLVVLFESPFVCAKLCWTWVANICRTTELQWILDYKHYASR